MRRFIISLIAAIAFVLAVGGAVIAGSGSNITQARLERSLPTVFSNVYTAQAKLLGHQGVTPASLHATAMCDKGGTVEANVGPGSNWNCLVSWTDPDNPMPPEGYGKIELNVHSNGCYTAAGPSKLVGFLTLNDTAGRVVTNPVAEFDACFDPHGNNTPTGVVFPSLLNVTTTAIRPDAQRHIAIQATCGTGDGGCQGTVTATAGDTDLGTIPLKVNEEQTTTLNFPTPVPSGVTEVTFTFYLTTGFGPTKPVTLEMPS